MDPNTTVDMPLETDNLSDLGVTVYDQIKFEKGNHNAVSFVNFKRNKYMVYLYYCICSLLFFSYIPLSLYTSRTSSLPIYLSIFIFYSYCSLSIYPLSSVFLLITTLSSLYSINIVEMTFESKLCYSNFITSLYL